MIQKGFVVQHKVGEMCFFKLGVNNIILDFPFGVLNGWCLGCLYIIP